MSVWWQDVTKKGNKLKSTFRNDNLPARGTFKSCTKCHRNTFDFSLRLRVKWNMYPTCLQQGQRDITGTDLWCSKANIPVSQVKKTVPIQTQYTAEKWNKQPQQSGRFVNATQVELLELCCHNKPLQETQTWRNYIWRYKYSSSLS